MPADGAQIVRDLVAAFARRDIDAMLAHADPELEFWPAGTAAQAGRTEPYHGHAGLREYVEDVGKLWEELVIEPGDLRVAGSGVVAFGTARVRAVGAAHVEEIPVIWVFKLRGDKILYVRAVATAAEAHAALGSRQTG